MNDLEMEYYNHDKLSVFVIFMFILILFLMLWYSWCGNG